MAFDINNIKEVGGPGNSNDGGQMYSQFSETDTLATMLASGYLDPLSYKLNVRDFIVLTGTDGAVLAQIVGNTDAGVVTVATVAYYGDVQTLTGAGAVDITSAVTELVTTSTDALTLADGAIGQQKIITMKTDGGTGTLTPTTLSGATTIAFADAGDSVILLFGTSGWSVIGSGGLAGGPVVA